MSVFRYPVVVRWSDVDSYDHVNNVRYFDYFQEARIAFLATALRVPSDGFFAAHPVVLAHQTVDYLRPIQLRHPPYDAEVWVESVGTTSYTLGSRIVDREQDVVSAKATSVLVAVDQLTQRKRPLSAPERAALTSHLRH